MINNMKNIIAIGLLLGLLVGSTATQAYCSKPYGSIDPDDYQWSTYFDCLSEETNDLRRKLDDMDRKIIIDRF